MKYVQFFFIWSVSFFFNGFAQETDSFYVSPSFYFTHGNYSDSSRSNSYAFYQTTQLSKEFFSILHYENLKISNEDWDYIQQAFLTGGIIDLHPFYFKLNYVHYKGDYDYKPFPDTYSDYTNLFNIDAYYFSDWYYLGASYVHLNRIGYATQKSDQITLRLEKVLSKELFLSLKPTFIKLLDGRELYSIAVKMHYQPYTDLIFKAGGFGGQRAFYFDSDLLTIFNQDETQKYLFFAQAEYSPIRQLNFILGFQNTKFTSYKINYFIAGIKSNLFIK